MNAREIDVWIAAYTAAWPFYASAGTMRPPAADISSWAAEAADYAVLRFRERMKS
jgi:hypothetical protein